MDGTAAEVPGATVRETEPTGAARLAPMSEAAHGFREGDKVWVQDGDGKRHPGVFVGDNEASGWFGGGPSAYVAHPEAHQAEVVSVFRITPRDE